MKNIEYGENKHNRTHSRLIIHTKTPNVAIQGNITVTRYRNDVIRSLLLPVPTRYDVVMSRG